MKNLPGHFQDLLRYGFVALALLLARATASAEIQSVFTVPPYAQDETIVDIEGWELQFQEPHPIYTDPMGAVVVSSPIANTNQPTALDLKTMVKNAKAKELGDRFNVETRFAVTFSHRLDMEGGLFFRFGSTHEASPFHFGFDYASDGGLYYKGEGPKVIVVPKRDVQENVAYEFTIQVDMNAQAFRVLVTCALDETFRHESGEIPFQDGFKSGSIAKTGGFFMGNNKPTVLSTYIDYAKITPSLE